MSPDAGARSQRLRDFCRENGVRSVRIEMPDLDGVVRGKRYSAQRLEAIVAAGRAGWSQAIFAWDLEAHVYGNLRPQPWMSGHFGDVYAVPDVDTLALVPWEDATAAVIVDCVDAEGRPVEVAPRAVLRRAESQLRERGLTVRAGVELEFVLLRETAESLREKRFAELQPADPGILAYSLLRSGDLLPVLDDIQQSCERAGIGVEVLHTEPGPGMVEAGLAHLPLVEAADQGTRFKLAVKQVARRHGLLATFMAAWANGLSGCGCHLHQSAWRGGDPVFASEDGCLTAECSGCLAGQLETMAEMGVLFNPTINSYKRCLLTSAAPRNSSWGIQNRTTAIRLIPDGAATRLEHRRSGADCNIYLALAGCVAGALHGLDRRLTPPPEVKERAYEVSASVAPPLPIALHEGIPLFRVSAAAREYLGGEFVDHFADSREWELDQFQRFVTDWELRRYLEQV
jgi:glutamine synthetase